MTTQPAPVPRPAARSGRRSVVRRSRPLSVITATVLALLLAGCATSFGAQTSQVYQPGPGITVRTSAVYVLNALVVTDGSGNGTLVAGLANQAGATDALKAVSLRGPTGKSLTGTILPGTLALPAHKLVLLGDPGTVRFGGTLQAGDNYTLTLTFANAAPVTMVIPLVPPKPYYTSVPVGPTPPPTTPSHGNP